VTVSLPKLQALRRESGAATPAAAPQPARAILGHSPGLSPVAGEAREAFVRPAAQSIEALRRLLGVRDRAVLPIHARGPVDRSLPGEEIAAGVWLTQAWLPIAMPPSTWPLSFARREDALDPRDLLFFDTETTGLAGGTGTRAFMIGAADFNHHPQHGDGLRVRQLLIATMAAEMAMLRMFAGWLSPRTVLSSYNGRCYDAPLLSTRYRLARLDDPLHGIDHVDLLFPSRRRWRGRWENCRLATIEREALGILREDDLPGSQAPAAWLQYLRGGSSTLLKRVAAHNRQDVVTLALLMARLVALHGEDTMCAG